METGAEPSGIFGFLSELAKSSPIVAAAVIPSFLFMIGSVWIMRFSGKDKDAGTARAPDLRQRAADDIAEIKRLHGLLLERIDDLVKVQERIAEEVRDQNVATKERQRAEDIERAVGTALAKVPRTRT